MSVTAPSAPNPPPPAPGLDQYISIRPGYSGGKPHVTGHRIKVQDIAVWHERLGRSAEEIAATYPGLSLAAVHAALAYYHSHRAEIEADIRADTEFVAGLRAQTGDSLVAQKLRAAHAQDNPAPPG